MLCYRCGSHVTDGSESCATCGQPLLGSARGDGPAKRRRTGGAVEGAPFASRDLIAGRFRVKSAVGKGPLGFVFRATDEQLEVEVALKALPPRLLQTEEERNTFSRILRGSRKLSHPSISRIFEDGEHDGWTFFTEPFLEGMSLRRILSPRLEKKQWFTFEEAEPILAQLASVVDATGPVGPHGHLKPENVLVLPDVLKVTDFGLARALPRPPYVQAQKPSGADRYLSPEYLGGGEVDARSDVYALGVILGEMMAGIVPEPGERPSLCAVAKTIPAALEGAYHRAVDEHPEGRFGTGAELLSALRSAARQAPPPLVTRAESPAARPRVVVGARADFVPEGDTGVMSSSPDALDPTQPISAEELAARLGRTETRTDTREEVAPAARKMISVPPVVPHPSAEGPTMALPTVPPEPISEVPSRPAPLFGAVRGKASAHPWTLLLAVLIIGGLALGAGGGFWLLSWLNPPGPHVVASTAPRPVAPPPKAAPTVASATSGANASSSDGAASGQVTSGPSMATHPAKASSAKGHSAGTVVLAADQKPRCPSGMVLIPAGPFRMGTARDDPLMGFDEKPERTVRTGAYCIDAYEYPGRKGRMPEVRVSWKQASRQCHARHARLCTEREWEKACKGPKGLRFPYGGAFSATACNTRESPGRHRLAADGHFAHCRSGYGVWDLSGNAAEWTASSYVDRSKKTYKGGAFNLPDYAARCSARKGGIASMRSSAVGFRCCAEPSR